MTKPLNHANLPRLFLSSPRLNQGLSSICNELTVGPCISYPGKLLEPCLTARAAVFNPEPQVRRSVPVQLPWPSLIYLPLLFKYHSHTQALNLCAQFCLECGTFPHVPGLQVSYLVVLRGGIGWAPRGISSVSWGSCLGRGNYISSGNAYLRWESSGCFHW